MQPGKWIEGLDPGGSPTEAAHRCLDQRLQAVRHFLPLAANHAADDVEYVHELRVATRRSMAALRLFAPMLPQKQNRAVLKDLRHTRETAGTARDLDVMVAHHADDPGSQGKRFLKDLRRRRAEAQKPIRAQCKRLSKHDRLRRRSERLLDAIRVRGEGAPPQRFDAWARIRLREVVEDFFAADPTDPTDLAALHHFRIRAKRLRYAMELLAPAFPEALYNGLYPQLEALQDDLGEINDHAVAVARFEGWLEDDGRRAKRLKALLRVEHEALDRALDAFQQRWDRAQKTRLRAGFEALASGPATL